MNYSVFFSPTGKTEKVVKHIGENFYNTENIDLSKPDLSNYAMSADDFCVVGVPSFGGRVPETAAARLQKITGKYTPAFLVVTYGGRAYEDTLKELKDILEKQGLICIGAATMVAEHSIIHQIEAGRPNNEDYTELDQFVPKIKERLQGEISSIEVPGNTPYKQYNPLPMEISASENCIKCGFCARNCPVGAIPLENPQLTDDEKCISCMRCVTLCPLNARNGNSKKLDMISEKLKKVCQPNKQNEFF